jgi:hypothetical protein
MRRGRRPFREDHAAAAARYESRALVSALFNHLFECFDHGRVTRIREI